MTGRRLTQLAFVALMTALIVLAPVAMAQPTLIHAEDNEAVTVDSFGNKRYRLPPMPLGFNDKPQIVPKLKEPFSGDVWLYETADGLIECSTVFRTNCRPHTLTSGPPRGRYWVVLRQGLWRQCHGPSRSDVCFAPVSLNGSKGDRSNALAWPNPPVR